MKQNKWIATTVCTCVAFFAGLIIGLSFFGRRQRKTNIEHILNSVNEESSDEVKEESPDE